MPVLVSPLPPSPSLRKRHWTQLMEVTGREFDMDPKTFTLGTMFSMQLHLYSEEVNRITNAALKELTIESELKKLADVWREEKFELAKYFKVGLHTSAGEGTLLSTLIRCAPSPVYDQSRAASSLWTRPPPYTPLLLPPSLTRIFLTSGPPPPTSQGPEDRGWVLKATEDVSVLLEDMGLNLQSMMASPFVKPFLVDVRSWEQKLSLIGECIEVRGAGGVRDPLGRLGLVG